MSIVESSLFSVIGVCQVLRWLLLKYFEYQQPFAALNGALGYLRTDEWSDQFRHHRFREPLRHAFSYWSFKSSFSDCTHPWLQSQISVHPGNVLSWKTSRDTLIFPYILKYPVRWDSETGRFGKYLCLEAHLILQAFPLGWKQIKIERRPSTFFCHHHHFFVAFVLSIKWPKITRKSQKGQISWLAVITAFSIELLIFPSYL